jgi:hypothetical protein
MTNDWYNERMDFSSISHRNLHHAYFLEGNHEQIIPLLLEYIEKKGITNKDNISVLIKPVFYIENSREIREEQHTVRDGRKIIIIAFDRIIETAQHALLKTIEEPSEGTHYVFISRNINALLPTVKSRLFLIKPHTRSDVAPSELSALEYLKSDYFGRTEITKELISMCRGEDDESDDERAIARRGLIHFLDSIERVLSDLLHLGRLEYDESIRHVISAKNDLNDPSPSIKMIFEHLTLRLPKLKS